MLYRRAVSEPYRRARGLAGSINVEGVNSSSSVTQSWLCILYETERVQPPTLYSTLYCTHNPVEQLRSPDNEGWTGSTTYHDVIHVSDNNSWLNRA
jgi:hypothetical protein